MPIGVRRAGNTRAGKVNFGNEPGLKQKGLPPRVGRSVSIISLAYAGFKLK
jgi:hypothetical protein